MSYHSRLNVLKGVVHNRWFETFKSAYEHSDERLTGCANVVDEYLAEKGIPQEDVCFVVLGSVGRHEALSASDIDLIPILRRDIDGFAEHDKNIRQRLRDRLDTKVSQGEDLTRFTLLSSLTDSETIGGDADNSASLTKRILILTEGAEGGGLFRLEDVRRQLLKAYASAERTCGRHVLSLCNDVARYYRTLCIEYKSKIDNKDKDWCTRNIKLRHSRKFWYFATLLAMVAPAREAAHADEAYEEALLKAFAAPPHVRMVTAIPEHHRDAVRPVLESYAWFLAFMGIPSNREALARVTHADRYAPRADNPFPAMKHNSDLLQREMLGVLETLDRPMRHRALDWFLF